MGNSASTSSVATLQAYHERQLKRLHLAPIEPPYVSGRADDDEDDDDVPQKPRGGLPAPADQEDVDTIGKLAVESKPFMDSAKAALETPPLPTDVNWELTLYMLFLAWIVNFGHDPSATSPKSRKSRKVASVEYDKQDQKLIHAAAKHLGVEWIPFIDLALAPYSDANTPISGPFAGVFVCKGDKPFMVLAFKGTTYPKEVTTDILANAKLFHPEEDVLYSLRTHTGMGMGLFETFDYVGETKPAFDTILEGLHRVAAELKGNSDRKIPVYVTGHSLGAGYCTIAYVELMRQLGLQPASCFDLYDCWAYGAPRVLLNSGVTKVKEVLAATNRHFYRPARQYDLVPNYPIVDLLGHTYKHLDTGYRLTPNAEDGAYWNVRMSEVGFFKPPINDGYPLEDSWQFHWPPKYYEAIRKILDNPPAVQKK